MNSLQMETTLGINCKLCIHKPKSKLIKSSEYDVTPIISLLMPDIFQMMNSIFYNSFINGKHLIKQLFLNLSIKGDSGLDGSPGKPGLPGKDVSPN